MNTKGVVVSLILAIMFIYFLPISIPPQTAAIGHLAEDQNSSPAQPTPETLQHLLGSSPPEEQNFTPAKDTYEDVTGNGANTAPASSTGTNNESKEGARSSAAGELENPLGYDNLEGLLKTIVGILQMFGIPVAAIMIIYAGYLYMTSGGDDKKTEKARKTLTYAIIGLVILVMAQTIQLTVVGILQELGK